jgi:hypothetical protein
MVIKINTPGSNKKPKILNTTTKTIASDAG